MAGVLKALHKAFTGAKEDKTKEKKESLKKEFPYDHVYDRDKKEIIKSSNALRHPSGNTSFRSKLEMFDEERIRAYFTETDNRTSIGKILKKRCSADGFLWNFYKNLKNRGIEPTVNMVKSYYKDITRTAKYADGSIKPPSPDILVKMLKNKDR